MSRKQGHLESWGPGNEFACYPGLNGKALEGVRLGCVFAKNHSICTVNI